MRKAAVILSQEAVETDEQSLDIRLLGDIKTVFSSMPHVSFVSTNVLLTELRKIDDAPWGEVDFTARKLAMRLGKFKVRPHHNEAKTERGYHLIDLYDQFRRYYPSDSSETVRTPADQDKRPDGSEPPDGLTRPDETTRPDVVAGQTTNGQVRTGPAVLTGLTGSDSPIDFGRPE